MKPSSCVSYRGMLFASMANAYLLECFEDLSHKTDTSKDNPNDWMEEWFGCKYELLKRLDDADRIQNEHS